MNQKYKDKYEELRNNDIGEKQSNDASDQKEEETYATPGNVRNIGFVWEGGRKMFLNYAYLVSVEIETNDEIDTMSLTFTTNKVKIKGHKLENLYNQIFTQKLRIIVQISDRYTETLENSNPIIREVIIS